MRISVDEKDIGFSIDTANYDVFLNNKRVTKCITADTEKGECLCYKADNEGKVIVDKQTGKIETVMLKGLVEIKRRIK